MTTGVVVKVVLNFISLLMGVWDLLFGWVYSIFTNPGLVRKNYARIRSRPTKSIRDGDTSVTYQPNDLGNPEFIQEFKVCVYSVEKHFDKNLLL